MISAPPEQGKYSVGTLHYTKAGLFVLFAWLLWGDFCYSLMERVWPAIFPLYLLKSQGFSNTTTNILMTTIPQILGVMVCPVVSFRSDRTRSRWGRRIPYMLFTAPFLCLFMGTIGFSGQIVNWLRGAGAAGMLHVSPMTVSLLVIGFLTIGFSFFNEFVNNIYWYLFADVVPKAFLGRFMGMFRAVGLGAEFLFRYFFLQYAESHMQWIFLGVSLLYLVGFGLMCWRVREGDYPPPEDIGERAGICRQAAVYVRDVLSHRIYILMFLYGSFGFMARAAMLGELLFFQSLPGIDLKVIGRMTAWVAIGGAVLAFPFGWLVDRFHPMRVALLGCLLVVPAQLFGFSLMHGYWSFLIYEVLRMFTWNLWQATTHPLYMSLFPRDKYGQFTSAFWMIRSLAIVVASFAAGYFMDYVTDTGRLVDRYRYMYLWFAAFQVLTLLCLVAVYRVWKSRGGSGGYLPPGSAMEKEWLARQAAQQEPVGAGQQDRVAAAAGP